MKSKANAADESRSSRCSSAAGREKSFREAIEAVCQQHGAELIVTDDGKPYGMASPILRVSMDGVWEGDVKTKEFCEFDW